MSTEPHPIPPVVLGSGEHEARMVMLRRTVEDVLFRCGRGPDVMTLIFTDGTTVELEAARLKHRIVGAVRVGW